MISWLNKLLVQFFTGDQAFYKEILLKRSFRIMVIQGIGLVLSLAANILLARIFGEQVFGVYSLVTSWSIFLAVLALFGMDDSHLVKLPTFKLNKSLAKIKAQAIWSFKVNFVTTILSILVAFVLINHGNIRGLSDYALEFNYGLVMVGILCFYNNLISFMRGMDFVVAGEIIDKIFRPTSFLLFLYVLYALKPFIGAGTPLLANNLALLIVFSTALIFILPYLRSPIPNQPINPPAFAKATAGTSTHQPLSPNLRYTVLNLLYLLANRLDILLLGILAAPVLVGHYNVASRFSELFSYPIAIINLSLPTLVAREKHDKGTDSSPAMLLTVARNSFFQCLLLDVIVLIAGNWFLSWYGKGFTQALPVLFILLASSLVSAFTGSIDVFFILHGSEKKAIYSRITSLAICLIIAIFLIPSLGIIGAALAMLGGNIVYCSMLEFLFYREYGLIIHPFHFSNPARN
jgi:O-antigen/teichoic acid export membrane protein